MLVCKGEELKRKRRKVFGEGIFIFRRKRKVEKVKEENIWRRRDILCRGEENGERNGGI